MQVYAKQTLVDEKKKRKEEIEKVNEGEVTGAAYVGLCIESGVPFNPVPVVL